MKNKVLFIDRPHPLLSDMLSEAGFYCDFQESISKDELVKNLDQYIGIVIKSRFALDREFLSKGTNLQFIARVGAGVESIDLEYAKENNIKMVTSPEGNRDSVGEQAVGMILSLFNNLNRADLQVRAGDWLREENRGVELMGKTVGIIGYGNMGKAFARRLAGFGVRVIAYDKYKLYYGDAFAEEVTLEEVFKEADVLSIHTPLTDETEMMLNADFFNSFAKSIYIINTARGKILRTSDLVDAIESGKVLGAALDVLEYESISFEQFDADHLPEAYQYILNSDRVVLTPHIAGWTHESKWKHAKVLGDKVMHYLKLGEISLN